MSATYRVALLGFSPFERDTLASCFRLATQRSPRYALEPTLNAPDFMLADADHAPSVQLVLAEDMLTRTVFIGTQAPAGATAWMRRPIDPLHVMRELDAMVALQALQAVQAVQAAPSPATGPYAPVLAPAPAPTPAHAPPPRPRRPRRATIEAAFEGQGQGGGRPQVPAPLEPRPSARALLVDDSDLARHFLARLLTPWGIVCDQAPTSQHALQCLAQRDYDCIFLDLELGPGSDLDGLALCQHIKRLHRSVQAALATVVMVSAHHSESDRVRGSLAGCDAYLGKPLQRDALHQLLLQQGLRAPAGWPQRAQAPRPA